MLIDLIVRSISIGTISTISTISTAIVTIATITIVRFAITVQINSENKSNYKWKEIKENMKELNTACYIEVEHRYQKTK